MTIETPPPPPGLGRRPLAASLRRTARHAAALLLVSAVAVLAACSGTAPRSAAREGMEPERLSLRLHDLVSEIQGQVEVTGYLNMLQSERSDERQVFRIWTIRMSEEIAIAAGRGDPWVAVVDLRTLAAQMRTFLEQEEAPHPRAYVVLAELCRTLEADTDAFIEEVAGPAAAEEARQIALDWTERFPIRKGTLMNRRSPAAEFIDLAAPRPVSFAGVPEDLDRKIELVAERIDQLNASLPKSLYWHVGLLLDTHLQDADLAGLIDASNGAIATLEGLPQVVDDQRSRLTEDVERMRRESFVELDAIVAGAVEDATAAIEATVERSIGAAAERLGAIERSAMAEIDRQRQDTVAEIVDVIREEREAALEDADRRIALRIDQVAGTLARPLALAMIAAFVAALLLLVAARLLFGPRRAA